MTNITEQIYSNEYKDYILPYSDPDIVNTYQNFGVQLLDPRYLLIHDSAKEPTFPITQTLGLYSEYPYVPKVFTLLNTVSLETSGIIQVQSQPYLNLSGKNTLIGFIDTGINYTHPAFLDSNGDTRILSIWDQTIKPETPNLSPFQYGQVFTRQEIQQALKSSDPQSVVPSTDEIGHGTAMAGIAAGTPDKSNYFTGVAFDAFISVVKLKTAKPYLYDYYFADKNSNIYQENDIMTAIRFLIDQSQFYNLPLIISIGLGTNQGDHNGHSALSEMVSHFSYSTYTTFAIASGNEGNKSHHAYHKLENTYEEVEILVPEQADGFIAELWGSTNSLLSIGFQSPLGTQIQPIAIRPGQSEVIPFVLEPTTIHVSYSIVNQSGGDQLIVLRFTKPSPGNWIVRVYNRSNTSSDFHIWLPITGLLKHDITFYNPDPYTTITIPSDATNAISTTSYNGYNQSYSIFSSRGFTRSNNIKPTICSPGENLTVPISNYTYGSFSGSSASAAILGGSISLLQQWRINQNIPGILSTELISGYLTRGALRDDQMTYPNRLWGYGKLNMINIFQSLME